MNHMRILFTVSLRHLRPFVLPLNQSFSVDRADTQPTQSRWQQLPDSATKREVLGGTKAGNGAWALAWVDTVMELPKPDDPPSLAALAREEGDESMTRIVIVGLYYKSKIVGFNP